MCKILSNSIIRFIGIFPQVLDVTLGKIESSVLEHERSKITHRVVIIYNRIPYVYHDIYKNLTS